jgi:vacuolar-type H+-ATPase subunit H
MARKEAEAEAGRLLAEGREQAKALLAEAEGRVPEAAKAVVEAILAGI